MKFTITGTDATTGAERRVIVVADDEAKALALAKSHGLFGARVDAISRSIEPVTHATTGPAVRKPDSAVEWRSSPLSSILTVLGVINIIAAVIAGLNFSGIGAAVAWAIFASGIFGGLILLAVAQMLDFQFESVQRLRQILRLLESKK